MKRLLIFLLPILNLPVLSPAQQPSLRDGDIVFQTLPCGALCDAILATTPCSSGRRFNHCGVVRRQGDLVFVIEAIGTAVQQTSLEKFTTRDTGSRLAVGRPHYQSSAEASAAAERAAGYIGTPYDDPFLPGDSALYCSELVWESCTSNGRRLFPTAPMTFKEAGKMHAGWVSYYRSLGILPPEGEPGINPCALASSDRLDFFWLPKGGR